MNYYARIHELLSADQVIAESTEEQQRIDELLGRIGRALGGQSTKNPRTAMFGKWNPLTGKYEGGLNQADRMQVFRGRAEAKKAAMTAKPVSTLPPKPQGATAQDFDREKDFYAGLSKPAATAAGAIGAAKPVTRRVKTPEQEEQSRKNREFAKAARSMLPTDKRSKRVFAAHQRAAIHQYTGAGKSERTPQNIRMAQAMGRYDAAKRYKPGAIQQGRIAQGDILAQKAESKNYYGEVANLIRESYQLNEKKKGPCWKGYEAIGMKMKGGRKVPNCVPKKK